MKSTILITIAALTFVVSSSIANAAGCAHVKPYVKWSAKAPNVTTVCSTQLVEYECGTNQDQTTMMCTKAQTVCK